MNNPAGMVCVAIVVAFSTASPAAPPSRNAVAAFERGEVALGASRFDVAATAYQEAINASPGYAAALNGLGSVLFRQKKVPEAMAKFRAATEAEPTFKLAWFNLGYAARKSSDLQVAALAYEKYTALDANDPDGFYGLAESYKGAGEHEKAIAAYGTYLEKETRPTEQKWIDKAKESIATLKAAALAPVAVAPVSASAVAPTPAPAATDAAKKIFEGDNLWASRNFRGAQLAYQDAVSGNPNDVEALFKLGNTYAVLGDPAQAIERWRKVQQVSEDPNIRQLASANIANAQPRAPGVVARAEGSDGSQDRPVGSRPRSLPFATPDHLDRGRLVVGSSLRVDGSYWEFVVSYTNTTGAPFSRVTVECLTLAGGRMLNAEARSEQGVAVGETVVFKVPVEDVAESAESGTCRVTRAER